MPTMLQFIIYTVCGFPTTIYTEIDNQAITYEVIPETVYFYKNGNFDFEISATQSAQEHYMTVLRAMHETRTKQTIVEQADQCI